MANDIAALDTVKGSDLAGTIARHPMHHLGGFFAEPRPLLPGDFVTTDSGTGLVHMAPDHGEDDFDLCKAHGLNPKFVVDADGRYREDWEWLPRTDERSGSVINPKFNAPDGPICSDLREAGALLSASADYEHSYPHSLALQGQGYLSLHAAMVCADGQAERACLSQVSPGKAVGE